MARLLSIRQALLGASFVAAVMATNAALAADLERVVMFRDGSLVKVSLPDEPLPWRRMTEDGRVFEEPVKVSQFDRLRLVRTPATDQVAVVRKLASQLGDADFHKREEAQAELAKVGGKFRNIISEFLNHTNDMEVKWRLNVLLRSLPIGQGLIDLDYDLLSISEAEKPVAGDVGAFTPTVKFRGGELALDRAKVAALGSIPLLPLPTPVPAGPRVRRIEANEDRLFPMDVTRVDFERGPRGEELAEDRDIAQVYAPLGCTFAVSIPGSYVSVQNYNVGGRSGGKCAATYSPRYQGTLTIRFCVPEFDRLPAGVRCVGLSLSHVAPKGTTLAAYDAFDTLLGEVSTTRTGFDFLALKCNTPIAYVKVVPNVEIDKDFAIDDLVFDRPQPLSEAGEPDRFSILLTTGERLFCAALEAAEGTLVLKQVSFGPAELKLPLDEIAVVVAPRKPAPAGDDSVAACYVRTLDGSLLRTSADGRFAASRFPKQTLNADAIVAFWGIRSMVDMPEVETWPAKVALLAQRDQEAKPLANWKLGPRWIESPDLPEGAAFTYADSPAVWLRQPFARAEASGLMRLVNGEELVLDAKAYTLDSWSAAGLAIRRGADRVTIPLAEIAAVVLPRKSK